MTSVTSVKYVKRSEKRRSDCGTNTMSKLFILFKLFTKFVLLTQSKDYDTLYGEVLSDRILSSVNKCVLKH